ncbi:MAG: Coenzyme F420 hydrogenase/dehydrogenase, beta subunit C-terminal domain [Planctomycetota bacterium]
MKTAADIVSAGLCTGCGLCASICPTDALRMQRVPEDILVPILDSAKCINCKKCVAVCGSNALADPPDWEDIYRGEPIAGYLARATEPVRVRQGQSGGVVSALASFLLSDGKIKSALLTGSGGSPDFGAASVWAVSDEDIRSTAGSKYCLNAVLETVDSRPAGPFLVVGVGCHIHSLRNLRIRFPALATDCYATIGLFCDRTATFLAQRLLLNAASVEPEDATRIDFRSKDLNGWPGDVRIVLRDGHARWLDRSARIDLKEMCTPYRCRLCFDKMNVFSDIAVSDAHGFGSDSRDRSAVIVYTQRGADIISAARTAGVIDLIETTPDAIRKGQKAENRRAAHRWNIAACQSLGRKTPDIGRAIAAPNGDPLETERAIKTLRAAVERDERFRASPELAEREAIAAYRRLRRRALRKKWFKAPVVWLRSLLGLRRRTTEQDAEPS